MQRFIRFMCIPYLMIFLRKPRFNSPKKNAPTNRRVFAHPLRVGVHAERGQQSGELVEIGLGNFALVDEGLATVEAWAFVNSLRGWIDAALV